MAAYFGRYRQIAFITAGLSMTFPSQPGPVLYNAVWEGWKLQVAVLHGNLSEAEQDHYIRQVTKKFPVSIVEKVILE